MEFYDLVMQSSLLISRCLWQKVFTNTLRVSQVQKGMQYLCMTKRMIEEVSVVLD